MSVVKEFKEFAIKGNIVDLAVAVIIGTAFGKIVTVLVERVLMPPLGFLIGGVDFSQLKIILKAAALDGKGEISIGYGEFLQTVFSFIIVAISIFAMVKSINAVKKKEASLIAPPPEDILLLQEIRDLLKK